jgi:hypothetical protein
VSNIEERRELEQLTLGQLADRLVSKPDSLRYLAAAAELARRQARAQIDAARFLLWSVIAIAITSGFSALFAFLSWYAPRGH